ncbi:MAG: hypothetical protein LKCHEGNO_03237 [Burkholderiaceae bacterium]|nr:hypothetical protein [Burkholderiaceae bacterium]
MQRRAERIEIGPWSLSHAARLGVLLDRRVAGLQDRCQRLAAIADHPPRGAEVEQHGRRVARHQHVVGRDVAVRHALAMQHLERTEQAFQ